MASNDKQSIIIIKKKKGDGHGGHHGGAWKVAYADFVTAMMAFFLVMWLMGSDEETKAAVSKYFNDPLGLEEGSSNAKEVTGRNPGGNFESEEQINARNDITDPNRPEIPTAVHLEEHKILAQMVDMVFEGSAFSVITDADQVKFQVPGEVLFQPNSIQISLEGRRYLAKLAPIIKDYFGKVTISGHSDDVKYEGQEDIWNLSFKRALTVRDYLVKVEGVKYDALIPAAKANTELIVRGLASSSNDRRRNKRVEFIFSHSREKDMGVEKKSGSKK